MSYTRPYPVLSFMVWIAYAERRERKHYGTEARSMLPHTFRTLARVARPFTIFAVVLGAAPLTACAADTPAAPTALPTGFDPQKTWVVSATGNDAAAGKATTPLKTIAKALTKAAPGDSILLTAGTYPAMNDTTVRTGASIVIRSWPGQRAELAGAWFQGGQRITLRDLTITGPIAILSHPVLKAAQTSENIQIVDSDISTGTYGKEVTGQCILIRHASKNVAVERNHIHHCSTGIAGVVRDTPSTNIVIRDNQMDHFSPDGIQLGSWHNTVISGNTIESMDDGGVQAHTDAIQFTGDVKNIAISQNVLKDSEFGQLLFMQAQYGAIDDVRVENNLITNAMGGIAVQAQGVTKFRFVNNTVWNTKYGALAVRPGPVAGEIPTDAVIANNVLESLAYMGGAKAAVQTYNVYSKPLTAPAALGVGDKVVANPGFDAQWRPAATSPLIGAGTKTLAPVVDLTGKVRANPPTIGAYEVSATSSAPAPSAPAVPTPTTPATPTPTTPTTTAPSTTTTAPSSSLSGAVSETSVSDGGVQVSAGSPSVPSGAAEPAQNPVSVAKPAAGPRVKLRVFGRRLIVTCTDACSLNVTVNGKTAKRELKALRSHQVVLGTKATKVRVLATNKAGGRTTIDRTFGAARAARKS